MNEYLSSWQILKQVVAGKNLSLVLEEVRTHPKHAKIKQLSYGVLRNYFSLQFIIKQLVSKADPNLVIWLMLGLFELIYSNKPDYAVINEFVNVSREKYRAQKIANFINAVLRNYLRQADEIQTQIKRDYHLYYNLPEWWLSKLKQQYAANYREYLAGFNYHPAFGLRVNPAKLTQAEYLALLNQANLEFQLIDAKLRLVQPIAVNEIPGFNDGLVSIQDIAAQYLLDILQRNQITFTRSLDCCAAPGGKTCQLLENYVSTHHAVEIDPQRLVKLEQNLKRLGLHANLSVGDASSLEWWDGQEYDLVIADVPCSASGTIKRNPDIKINRRPSDIANFVAVQRAIIANVWQTLRPGGHLVYITCSIFNEENQENINWFNHNLNGFIPIDHQMIIPTESNDSLYYSLIRKH
jgi:16S rRNA (cytosine967-C5)-methyltransferase